MISEKLPSLPARQRAGFSLIEVLIVVAVIGVVAGVATFFVKAQENVGEIKLRQDVSALNKAVKVYMASGGEIGAEWETGRVLAALKQRAANEADKRLVGLSGSLIDLRMGFVMESEQDAQHGQAKAVWVSAERRFAVVEDERLGVQEFVLEDRFIPEEGSVDARETAVLYAKESSWVWDYIDRSNAGPSPGVRPATGSVPYPNPPVPVTPVAQVLLPPIFSHPAGNYPYTDFDLPMTMSADQNVPGSYEIYYSVDGGAFELYAGATVAIPRGGSIIAFAKTTDPERFSDSSSATTVYEVEQFKLAAPTITTDYAFFDTAANPQIAVSIDEANDPSLPQITRYRVEGGPWKDYAGPFVLDAVDYPRGAEIEAAVFGLETWVVDSDPATTLLKYKLSPPTFAVSSTDDIEATVAIAHPNDPLTSLLNFRQAALPSANYGAESLYGSPLMFAGVDYPAGVRVAARAVARSARFIDSDEVAVDVFLVDPEDWEIEGVADGTFSGADGGDGLVADYDNDGSMFSWGEGAWPTYLPSSVEFTGAEFSQIRPREIFKIGDISYYNGSIIEGTGAEGVELEVAIAFDNDRSVRFQIPVELVNVVNGEGFTEDEAADYLRIPYNGIVQDLRIYGADYRVAIAFGSSTEVTGDTSLTEFHVWENSTASAEVYAAIFSRNSSIFGVLGWMIDRIERLNN